MPDLDSPYLFEHTDLLCGSYRHWTGDTLLADEIEPIEAVRALYEAPFVVVSHGIECDPIFNYGNRMALDLFEMPWEEFIALPSRLSAEPVNQKERYRLLAKVSTQGYSNEYTGVRISKSGRRFMISGATVWNLIDGEGRYRGQAAVIREWRPLA